MAKMTLMQYQAMSPEERDAHDELTLNRRVEAWKLHGQGHSYSEIARRLDISAHQARHDVLKHAREVSAEELQDLATQRAIEYNRLETLIESALPSATSDKDMARLAMQAMQRKSKLLGLDAPTKFQHAVMQIRPKKELPREEVDRKLVELYDRLTSRGRKVDPSLEERVKAIRAGMAKVVDVTEGAGKSGVEGGPSATTSDPIDAEIAPEDDKTPNP